MRSVRSSRLRAALAAAAVAFVLAAPIAGARVEAGAISFRVAPVLTVCAASFLVALAAPRRHRAAITRVGRRGAWIGVSLAVAVIVPLLGSRRLTDVGAQVLTYVMLGWGLNVVVGLAGLLDLGYVAFYAVGAYAYAILSTGYGVGFWACLPICAGLAAAAGMALGFPVLRLRGDYLAVVTLAFGEITRIVINTWSGLTNGPRGILDIPRPTLFGWAPRGAARAAMLYYVILVLALATNALVLRLRRLPIGRAWEAVREDGLAARSLGVDTTATKLAAFATGAAVAGVAGAFFAARQAFVSPESFTFIESATVLAIVVLGGMGSQLGTALAAVLMVGGVEALRDALAALRDWGALSAAADAVGDPGRYRMIVFGLALVTVIVLRPGGLIGGRRAAR